MATLTFLQHRTSDDPPEKSVLECDRCDAMLFSHVCRTCEGKGHPAGATYAPCAACESSGHRLICPQCGYILGHEKESPAWLDTEPVGVAARFLNVSLTVAAEVVAIAGREFLELHDLDQIDRAWRIYCEL